MKDENRKRYAYIRNEIYKLVCKYQEQGIRDYVAQAIKEISKKTGYSVGTLEWIYYHTGGEGL